MVTNVTGVTSAQESLAAVPRAEIKVQPNRRLQIMVALLTVYVIWGTTYLGIHYALESFPPYLMMGIRFILAGGGLFLFLILRGAAMPTPKQWRSAIIVGGLLMVGGMGSVAMAEVSISSGLAATLAATAPLLILVFSAFWGYRPGRMEWVGVAVGFLGVGLLTLEGNLQANPASLALMLFATVCWSLGSVFSNRLEMPKGAMGNAAEMLAGGIMLTIFALATGERIIAAPTLRAVAALAYLTTFGSLATITAYMFLLKTVKPSLATSYAFVNPVIALLLGVVVGGEQLTGSALIALPVILIGVAFVAFGRKRDKPADHH